MILILGAGLAGLAASYHIGHHRCLLLEKSPHAFGHAHSESRNGFTWDEGPHVSFTRHDYVKELFAASVSDEYDEYSVKIANYFEGHWIDHPAQCNLYQVPEPLRSDCLESFLESRRTSDVGREPLNYAEWLELAFGATFTRAFPESYTKKYWTVEPDRLTTDWIGSRVFFPPVNDVIAGAKGPLTASRHYITKVRYPKEGGYQAFARLLAEGANILYGRRVSRIDLANKTVYCDTGESFTFTRLISSIPLPVFVNCTQQSTPAVRRAADALCCSQLLLINVEVPHPASRPENWLYIYDRDKYATRIHFLERLASKNAPVGRGGIQIEVYFSRYKPLQVSVPEVVESVVSELFEMGLIDSVVERSALNFHTKWVDWANVVFDLSTRECLDVIFNWCAGFGLERESDDLSPLTDWEGTGGSGGGTVQLAGRFGQWKYYWTDDCILRGRMLAGAG